MFSKPCPLISPGTSLLKLLILPAVFNYGLSLLLCAPVCHVHTVKNESIQNKVKQKQT